MGQTAPDLKGGYIVNGANQNNMWTTGIQSVLVENGEGGEKRRYLSQECRRENVPFSSGYLGGSDQIFMRDVCLEFITYSCDGNFFQMPVFDSLSPTDACARSGVVKQDDYYVFSEVTSEDWVSSVRCDDQEIAVLDFADLLEGVADETVNINDLYMKVAWQDGGAGYQLYCPCRYLNYANPKHEKTKYLQPISGYVLIPLGNGGVSRGYVACSVNSEGETIIELATDKYNDLIELLINKNVSPELKPVLEKLQPLLPLTVSSMNLVKKVQGEIEFFVYK